MKLWASARSVRSEVADVPERWLIQFALHHPEAIRKFGASKNATMLYNTQAIVKAIEEKEAMQ